MVNFAWTLPETGLPGLSWEFFPSHHERRFTIIFSSSLQIVDVRKKTVYDCVFLKKWDDDCVFSGLCAPAFELTVVRSFE